MAAQDASPGAPYRKANRALKGRHPGEKSIVLVFFILNEKNKRRMAPKAHRFDSVSTDRIDGLPLRFSPSLYLAEVLLETTLPSSAE